MAVSAPRSPASLLDAPSAHSITPEPSLLQRLMSLLSARWGCAISFDDLSGVSFDVPELQLPERDRVHGCEFCTFAKRTRGGMMECVRNKQLVNRLVIRRERGLVGQCRLGLTDIVEPLVYQGHVLGIFYFGSVLLEGSEERMRARLTRRGGLQNESSDEFVAAARRGRVVGAAELEVMTLDLRTLCEVCLQLISNAAPAISRYRTEAGRLQMNMHRNAPILLEAALRYLRRNYNGPVELREVAAHLRCSEHHLCRCFRKYMGMGLGEYVFRLRIDHARRLLRSDRFSVGEIGFQSGFQSDSHFIRVFRRLTGTTPRQFRESFRRSGPDRPELFRAQFFSDFT